MGFALQGQPNRLYGSRDQADKNAELEDPISTYEIDEDLLSHLLRHFLPARDPQFVPCYVHRNADARYVFSMQVLSNLESSNIMAESKSRRLRHCSDRRLQEKRLFVGLDQESSLPCYAQMMPFAVHETAGLGRRSTLPYPKISRLDGQSSLRPRKW